MINTGYLFSNEPNRLFVNTSLGCSANCSYCYLPLLNYSKGKKLNNYIKAEDLIAQIESYEGIKYGKNGTLISFGCYSECWDDINKPQTIKLIKYFLDKGNQIQFSTKRFVDYNDLIEIKKYIKYYGQLTIFISSATISEYDKYEKGTTAPLKRFESFNIIEKLNIPVVLYIKPVLKNITIKDINKYIEVIKKYNIKDVIVGSILKTNGTGEVAPFINDNSIHTKPIDEEKNITDLLSQVSNVYTKSIHVLDKFK